MNWVLKMQANMPWSSISYEYGHFEKRMEKNWKSFKTRSFLTARLDCIALFPSRSGSVILSWPADRILIHESLLTLVTQPFTSPHLHQFTCKLGTSECLRFGTSNSGCWCRLFEWRERHFFGHFLLRQYSAKPLAWSSVGHTGKLRRKYIIRLPRLTKIVRWPI